MDKPKIGLFGYYNYDNWGDNLMALVFASYLKQQDASFSVFIDNSKKYYYEKFFHNTEDTIDKFLADKDFVIFGGGGILVPAKYEPEDFSKHSRDLISACKKKGLPIYGISIGGIGNPRAKLKPLFRRELLNSMEFATVRNSQDLPLLKSR